MKVSMYILDNGDYRLLENHEVLTVKLPEGSEDREDTVVQAVVETMEDIDLIMITSGESE